MLISLDKLLREKRKYQGDLSASINDALLAVNLNTVKLVTLHGKKKQTARETQVVILRRLIQRLHLVAEARSCSVNQLVNSGTDDPEVRGKCGIQKALGYWRDKGAGRQIVGEQRWFAGFFTTAEGGGFFPSEGPGCGEKAYTLTSKAKTPEERPLLDDPDLRKTITEADYLLELNAKLSRETCFP